MSLGGSASTASMPFVLVGEAIVEQPQWRQCEVWSCTLCRRCFLGYCSEVDVHPGLYIQYNAVVRPCGVGVAHDNQLSLAQQRFALAKMCGL